MSDQNYPDPGAIRNAEEQGLVFSEDQKILLTCENKELSAVVIPDGVTEIGDNAFYGCTNLTGIVIPPSVTSIEESAFYGCSSLSDITIPDSVTKIAAFTFEECENLTAHRHDTPPKTQKRRQKTNEVEFQMKILWCRAGEELSFPYLRPAQKSQVD